MRDKSDSWEEAYQEYLEYYDDDNGKRRKLDPEEFRKMSRQMIELVAWSRMRKLTLGEQRRLDELAYLLII